MRRIVSPAEIRAYDTDTSSTGSCFQPQQDESDDETMSNVGDNEDGEPETRDLPTGTCTMVKASDYYIYLCT